MARIKEKLGKNFWNNIDKTYLELGYTSGASLQLLSEYFKKSYDAVSKALDRFNIRQTQKIQRSKVDIPIKSLQDLRELFQRTPNLRNDRDGSRRYTCQFQQIPFPNYRRKERDIQNGWCKTKGSVSAVTNPLEMWTDMHQIIQYLESRGHRVRPAHNNLKEHVYILDRQPCTCSQILIAANRLRLKYKELPFYVEGITE